MILILVLISSSVIITICICYYWMKLRHEHAHQVNPNMEQRDSFVTPDNSDGDSVSSHIEILHQARLGPASRAPAPPFNYRSSRQLQL